MKALYQIARVKHIICGSEAPSLNCYVFLFNAVKTFASITIVSKTEKKNEFNTKSDLQTNHTLQIYTIY